MKASARQRILAAAAGCLIAAAATGTAGAAPLTLQPASNEPAAPAVAGGGGSLDDLAGGNLWFSVSQGSSEMFWNVFELIACNALGSTSPFICGFK